VIGYRCQVGRGGRRRYGAAGILIAPDRPVNSLSVFVLFFEVDLTFDLWSYIEAGLALRARG
jgi:hypothetical protein